LSALTMPVLVIVGERDTDDMPDASPARRPTRGLSDRDASHHPSLEQPEAFNRLLLEFVA
jgi:pimeloyl-ACP methyl ester carboxylesterase